ncbi:MAG: SRPBCC family protein [Actinobacteria bacterium]|nr:SRPBCC family protein [Actinomycetota bacterium]
MAHISVSIEIDATPQRVWEVVEPVERHVDWMHDAVAIRFETDQTRGVGTRFLCDTKVGPIKLVDQMEITEWRPGEAMGVRHTGIVTGTGMFTLTPIDLGRRTRFTWAEELIFPWWLGGPIGAWIGGKLVMGAIWRRNLRGLARIVEQSS